MHGWPLHLLREHPVRERKKDLHARLHAAVLRVGRRRPIGGERHMYTASSQQIIERNTVWNSV
jgi:hypothetical protein